ncbi:hypothetical protein D9M71_618290 [compost metagenome]
MVGEQRAQPFDVVAPVAVQFTGQAEPGHQLRALSGHTVPRRFAGQFVEGAGRVGDHEHVKTFGQRRKRRERHAHFRHHTGDDQLFLAGGLDRLDEIFVVPGVDLARASDVRRVRKQCLEFGHQRSVGTGFETGGEDGRQLEVLGQVSQRQHVVLESIRIDVAHQRQQARLMINHQNRGVVLVQTLVGRSHCSSPRMLSMPIGNRRGVTG